MTQKLTLTVYGNLKLSDNGSEIVGPDTRIDNFIWKLHARRFQENGIDYVGFRAECKSIDKTIRFDCDADLEVNLYHNSIHQFREVLTNQRFDEVRNISDTAKIHHTNWSMWSKFNSITMFEVIITKYKFEEIRCRSFYTKDDNLSDIELIVGDKRLYASKHILAQYSKMFYDMIYRNDQPITELEITNCNSNDFSDFLAILYNQQIVTMENFEIISELSKRFGVDSCLEECEKFLINCKNIGSLRKLGYSKTLGFKILENSVVKSFKSVKEISQLRNEPEFNSLGDNIKVALFDRIMELESNLHCDDKRVLVRRHIGEKRDVQEVTIGGVPFRVTSPIDVISDNKYNFMLQCNWEDMTNPWKCEVFVEVMKNAAIFEERVIMFDSSHSSHKFSYNNVLYDISILIKVISVSGIFVEQRIDFTKPREDLTDVVLSVGEKKFHVSKQILANSCTYFYSMFYSDFNEKHQTDIILKDIDADDFEEFLQHVYNPYNNVPEKRIEGLLELSQIYDYQQLSRKCIHYLRHDGNLNDALKIKLAEIYGLDDFMRFTMSRIQTYDDFKKLSMCDGFEELSKETIADVAVKVLNPPPGFVQNHQQAVAEITEKGGSRRFFKKFRNKKNWNT